MNSPPSGYFDPPAGGQGRRPHRASRRRGALFSAVALLALAMSAAGCNQQASPPAERSARLVETDSAGLAALLPATDLGPDWHEAPRASGQPVWPWHQSDCPAYRPDDYGSQLHRRVAVQRLYRVDESSQTAHHVVESYQPGWGGRALDDVLRVLRLCANYSSLGARISFVVVRTPDLGDGTLLVRGRIERDGAPPAVAYLITVRRGDTVSTLKLPDPERQAVVEAIAARQVARLD